MKYISIVLIAILCGCASAPVDMNSPEVIAAQNLVASNNFEIESNFAFPLTSTELNQLGDLGLLGGANNGSRISLIGNDNFLRIQGDTVHTDLPYFGTRRSGITRSTETGIIFQGIPENYNEIKKDNNTEISFSIRQESERFDVTILIFPKGSTRVSINSTQRTHIRYDGIVKAIDLQE